jgi:hypothetical protein
MIRRLLLFSLLAGLLAACKGRPPATEPTLIPSYPNLIEVTKQPASYPNMIEPTQPPSSDPINTTYRPEPGDSGFTRGEAFIDSSDLLIMESNPIQVALALKGNLPTPCNKLRVVASPPDEQNRIQVEVYSVIDPDQMCAQVLEPFEANVNLGSFPSGHYIVWVNEEKVGEFDA